MRVKAQSTFLKTITYLAAAITIAVFLLIVGYILVMGVPNLSLDLFAFKYNSTNVSLFPALINTFIMVGVTLAIGVPLGIFASIYLVEYANKSNKVVKLIRLTSETLAGIPSIVYGLFGFLMFV